MGVGILPHTTMCNIKITLHYSVYMRTSGEKVRISHEAERVQAVSYSHEMILKLIYSGVFKGRKERHLSPLQL